MKKKLTTTIREYRMQNNMSQQELADLTGVRRETIIRLEKGAYNPSLQLAMDISHVFHTTVEELFTFTAEKEDEENHYFSQSAGYVT